MPNWAESKNNTQAAHQHYLLRLIAEGESFRSARPSQRAELVLEWLESAEANTLYVQKRVGYILGRRPPVERWRTIVEEIAD